MAPTNNIVDRLPILSKVLKWFKGDQTVIDGPLFKLHYQASTFIIMIGFIFVFVENHLDVKAILCQTGPQYSAYANQYCWIHGTAYVRRHLQGKATGCFVDQTRIQSEEDAPVTAYYLWLPYLLSLLFLFAKFPHSAWKRFFENELIKHILEGSGGGPGGGKGGHQGGQGGGGFGGGQGGFMAQLFNEMPDMPPDTGPKPKGGGGGGGGKKKWNQNQKKSEPTESADIASNFMEFRSRYNSYHQTFGFWEFMNGVCVFFSMCVTHWLLNYKFFPYGLQVFEYIEKSKTVKSPLHDPMCELFPTEVSCSIQIGASTGGVDKSNFLCILGNNLFNQKYFFVLWVWWTFLLIVCLLGFIYRVARILVPGFSRYLLLRKIHGNQLSNTRLNSGDYFVLEQVLANLTSPKLKDQVLEEVGRLCQSSSSTCLEPLLSPGPMGHHLSPSQGGLNTPIYKGREPDHIYKGREPDHLYKGGSYPPNQLYPNFSTPTAPVPEPDWPGHKVAPKDHVAVPSLDLPDGEEGSGSSTSSSSTTV